MVSRFVVVLTLWPVCTWSYVTVLRPQQGCQGIYLERATEGLKLDLDDDPTDHPPTTLSQQAYTIAALSSLNKVYEVYRQIFRRLKMDEREIEHRLQAFAAADRARLTLNESDNGLDNTVYFVRYNSQGEAVAVLRATLIRQGESRSLDLESRTAIPDQNRVELERAFNASHSRSGVIAGEMMMVMAKYFQKYFGTNNYTLFALTNDLRAHHYQTRYGFNVVQLPNQPEITRNLCLQVGENFYYRYAGHCEAALDQAFVHSWDPNGALQRLKDMENQPGLRNYIPNLVTQSIVLAGTRRYAEAVAVSDHLRTIGQASVNEDYNVLWSSRNLYDALLRRGKATKADQIIDQYLFKRPLQHGSDRTLLFAIYKIKLLLSREDFAGAQKWIDQHRSLLIRGMVQQQSIVARQRAYLEDQHLRRNSCSRLRPSWTAYWRAREEYLRLMMDVSTSPDPFATPVLDYRLWEALAEAWQGVNDSSKPWHWPNNVAQFLKGTHLTQEAFSSH